MKEVDEDTIRQYAHVLWQQAGSPEGREDEFWFQAKAILEQRTSEQAPITP